MHLQELQTEVFPELFFFLVPVHGQPYLFHLYGFLHSTDIWLCITWLIMLAFDRQYRSRIFCLKHRQATHRLNFQSVEWYVHLEFGGMIERFQERNESKGKLLGCWFDWLKHCGYTGRRVHRKHMHRSNLLWPAKTIWKRWFSSFSFCRSFLDSIYLLSRNEFLKQY